MLIRIHSEDLFMMLCMAIGEQPSDATSNASRAVDMFKYMMTDEAHVDMFETMDYQFIDTASDYKTIMLRYSGNIFALPQYALRISFDENDIEYDKARESLPSLVKYIEILLEKVTCPEVASFSGYHCSEVLYIPDRDETQIIYRHHTLFKEKKYES